MDEMWSKLYYNPCLLYRIPLHWPTTLTLFKKYGWNETVHRSGPPPRTRNVLTEHLVLVIEKQSCTRRFLRKFRVLGGGPDL